MRRSRVRSPSAPPIKSNVYRTLARQSHAQTSPYSNSIPVGDSSRRDRAQCRAKCGVLRLRVAWRVVVRQLLSGGVAIDPTVHRRDVGRTLNSSPSSTSGKPNCWRDSLTVMMPPLTNFAVREVIAAKAGNSSTAVRAVQRHHAARLIAFSSMSPASCSSRL